MVLVCGSVTVGITLPVYAQGEYVVFPETASVSSSSLTPLDFKLKAISKPSGDVEKVSGFKLDPVNVLSLSESGIISAASTDQAIVFDQAKAKSSTDSLFELQKASIKGQSQQQQQSNSGFSIAGLAPGVYTLDLIGTKNGAKAAYEGILVIAQDKESPQVKQVVEKEIKEVEQDTTIVDVVTIFQTPPAPLQPQQQLQPLTGPIAQQLIPSGTGAGPLGAQPQQLAAIPLGSQGLTNQPLSPSPSPSPSPTPQPQALAAQSGLCPQGFEGTPPQCTPIEPGNEPVDLLSLDPSSLDPNDPLFGEPRILDEETGEGEETEDLEDTDAGDSDSESNDAGGGDGEGGDNDSGDGGDGDGEE